jgi:hypothetical protein
MWVIQDLMVFVEGDDCRRKRHIIFNKFTMTFEWGHSGSTIFNPFLQPAMVVDKQQHQDYEISHRIQDKYIDNVTTSVESSTTQQ